MDIGSVVDIFSSGGLGGILGVVGGFAAKLMDLKKKKLEIQDRLSMAKIQLQEGEAERAHELAMFGKQGERARLEGEIQQDIQAGDAFIESIRGASKPTGNQFVDSIKGAMRPIITSILMGFTIWLTIELWEAVGGLSAFDKTELIAIFKNIVNQIVFLTVMAVSWWYAARPGRLGAK